MSLRGGEILTKEQRLEYTSIPEDLSEEAIVAYYTFSQYDIDIINSHRRDYNRLGYALQLSVLRYLGWPLSITKDIPQNVIKYVSKQIDVDTEIYLQYGQREATIQQHMDGIRQEYGYKSFTKEINKELFEVLLKCAMENGNSICLIKGYGNDSLILQP